MLKSNGQNWQWWSLRRSHRGLPKGEGGILRFWEGKGGEWVCEKEINSYVWKGVVHGKDVCK
jgi:hypothetical protein